MNTLIYTGALTVTSCWCGIHLAIPEDLYNIAQRKRTTVYCPLGHTFVYGDPEYARLKREAQLARDRAASLRADLDQSQASLRATKGVVTKLRKRAITGTCAFCHRHFANVERHVATVHPTETPDA